MTTNKSIVKVTRPDAPDPPPTCGGVPGTWAKSALSA